MSDDVFKKAVSQRKNLKNQNKISLNKSIF